MIERRSAGCRGHERRQVVETAKARDAEVFNANGWIVLQPATLSAVNAAERLELLEWLVSRGATVDQLVYAAREASLAGLAGDLALRPLPSLGEAIEFARVLSFRTFAWNHVRTPLAYRAATVRMAGGRGAVAGSPVPEGVSHAVRRQLKFTTREGISL